MTTSAVNCGVDMGTEQPISVLHAVLSATEISVQTATEAVDSATAGAVVSFSGVVRNHDGGRSVERLSYTAHPSAEHVLAEVVAEVVARHSDSSGAAGTPSGAGGKIRIWAAHRVGPLQIGDAALVCAVSAAHRGQAFAVCSELVDLIKERVPIWKEQFFTDGSVEWVGAG